MRVRQGMPVHTRHTLWLRHCPKHAAAAATLLIVRPHALSVRSRALLAVVTVRQLIVQLLSRCYGRLPSRTLRRIGPIAKPCATPRLRTTAPTRARNLRPYARISRCPVDHGRDVAAPRGAQASAALSCVASSHHRTRRARRRDQLPPRPVCRQCARPLRSAKAPPGGAAGGRGQGLVT
jgi:hypothetical protein